MGKRSSFKRIDKDHYPTIDPRALPPLLAHLPKGVRYAEPCAGEGHLIDQLERAGVELAWADTLQPNGNGDALKCEIGDADCFITNPPWGRKLLHPLIEHLSDQAPTWLLFDANWVWTKQAKPFWPRMRKVVAVGRLIWIEGTKVAAKDDAAWYCFDRPIADNVPLLYGQGVLPAEPPKRVRRICADCGEIIGRFDRWRLTRRASATTPAHVDCRHPLGEPPEPAPTPLFSWGGLECDA